MRHHEAAVSGWVARSVTCEHCQGEYVYVLTREGAGFASGLLGFDENAPIYAARQANAELRRSLARDQDPVPCPSCGWYQRSMVGLIRDQHRGWLGIAGAFLIYASALIGVPGMMIWALSVEPKAVRGAVSFIEAGAWGSSVGGVLILIRRTLALGVRPNEGDPQARMEISRRRAWTRAEFDKLTSARPETE